MKKENRDLLMRLLQQHKELGISEQIDFDKSYMDSLIANSVALSNPFPDPIEEEMVDKWSIKPSLAEKLVDKWLIKPSLAEKLVDKWLIKPSLAEKMVDILEFVVDKDQITTEEIVSHFGFNPTTAKRYLRQLTVFGYLEAHGGNKNRTYSKKDEIR